jgi:hypothetical protein
MQQYCHICGYETSGNDRFCRQCGGSLISENEVSTATTRNYGRPENTPSPANVSSGRLPPSIGDAIAGETERYYHAPPAPNWVSNTAPIKSKFRSWRWIALFLVLFIGAALGAMVTASFSHRDNLPIPPEEFARMEAQRHQDEIRSQIEDRMREAQDRAREAQERQMEALERAREAADRAREAGAAIAVANEKLLDLTEYEYPGATVSSSIRIPGHEILNMTTPDSFDKIREHFQKKLGKPIIEINEPWEKKLLFQSTASGAAPSISVSVETDHQNNGQLKISVLRSPFQLAKPEIQIEKPEIPKSQN